MASRSQNRPAEQTTGACRNGKFDSVRKQFDFDRSVDRRIAAECVFKAGFRVCFKFGESRFQRLDPEQPARNDVCRCRAPRVIPVLIRLERIVPCFHGNGCALADHVHPAPESIGGHEFQCVIGETAFAACFQQKLCREDAACHTA